MNEVATDKMSAIVPISLGGATLYIGKFTASERVYADPFLSELERLNVQTIINSSEIEIPPYVDVHELILKKEELLPDEIPTSEKRIRNMIRVIDEGRKRGSVLIVCDDGRYRSALIAGCYFASKGIPAANVIQAVQTCRYSSKDIEDEKVYNGAVVEANCVAERTRQVLETAASNADTVEAGRELSSMSSSASQVRTRLTPEQIEAHRHRQQLRCIPLETHKILIRAFSPKK